ncbi:MAG TPA: PAS domain-containing protein [Rhizomicrobium sp.]|nr:PAS domain-containing protein [Rhizomicrobium sp.]
MNILAAARALNQKAVQQNWHHYCDASLAFSDDCYQDLISLWRAKAAGRPMPSRSEFSARDLKDLLRSIVIFERISRNPSRYLWRLIGTRITEIAGHHTGKTFEETIPKEHLPRWVECFDLVLDGGQPMRFLGRVHISGREYLDAENLFLPLANANGEPSFAMGLCRYTPRQSENEESWENQIASIPGALL